MSSKVKFLFYIFDVFYFLDQFLNFFLKFYNFISFNALYVYIDGLKIYNELI